MSECEHEWDYNTSGPDGSRWCPKCETDEDCAAALIAAEAEIEQMTRERNYLHKILNKLFGWKDESWLHAVAHIENAVINLQTSLRVERKLQKLDEARVEQLREAIARFVKQYPWQDGPEIQELKSLVQP